MRRAGHNELVAAEEELELNGDYFHLPQEHVVYGPGSLSRLGAEVERLKGERAFLITGHSLSEKTDFVDRIREKLGHRWAGMFAGIRQHTPKSDVTRGAAEARAARADLLLSLGGGSPIDGTKAVARAIEEADGRLLPHLAIPTTLSAAEFSHLVGVTDEEKKAKTGFADPRLVPRSVILDPELTQATPMPLWLSSGMRAMDHAVETLLAPGDHPIPDVMALEAIDRLFRLLPASKENAQDVTVRGELQIAAWMSFFGEVNTAMGMSHILGRRVGARYDVPHGVTSCITLPWVMEAEAARKPAPLAAIGRRIAREARMEGESKAARAAAQAMRDLVSRLGLPARLSQVGVPHNDLASIAEAAYPPGEERARALELLERMW
ncbi:MAG TPA: iron-containing alcohol dehydrogenase [Anaerolineales bacterium]|nr:iron-containing alcohol dehydrogenase [Anaerolineales bacterium]